jgi:cobyrinic acid a,c-diamide synthase
MAKSVVTTFLHGHFDHFDSDKIIAGILKNSVETDRRTKYFRKTKEDSGGVECELRVRLGSEDEYTLRHRVFL